MKDAIGQRRACCDAPVSPERDRILGWRYAAGSIHKVSSWPGDRLSIESESQNIAKLLVLCDGVGFGNHKRFGLLQ